MRGPREGVIERDRERDREREIEGAHVCERSYTVHQWRKGSACITHLSACHGKHMNA